MKPHAFIAMPFGTKPGADDEQRAGDLRTDMFQELLVADQVLADETPTQALWLEAKRQAGNCLLERQHFELALQQFDAALELEAEQRASLEEAIAPYHQAFIADPSHHYSGIDSPTLHLRLRHLGEVPDKEIARLADAPRVMPDELGPLPEQANAFERCKLWLLDTALAWCPDKVRFICLWDGGGGGPAHMYDEVKHRTGRVTWIDTRKLRAPKDR